MRAAPLWRRRIAHRMGDTRSLDVDTILARWNAGDREALARLIPLVYDDLRRVAAGYLRHERPSHTLQATALVHEAYMRLAGEHGLVLQDRKHFFAAAAAVMRHVLIDHARAKGADKRGGDAVRVQLDEALDLAVEQAFDLVALDEALTELASFDPRQARIVELRYFGGLSIEETAEAISASPATVKREWTIAKAWLFMQLSRSEPKPSRDAG